MKLHYWILLITVFFVGMLVSQLFSSIILVSGEETVSGEEQLSPSDHISENQIQVYDDYVLLDVPGVEWSTFSNTNSMDPFLDAGANALQFIPESSDDVAIGDIVSYRAIDIETQEDIFIIHRVVYKAEDEQGVYFITKGDNNVVADPGKVRFEQIDRVLFAIIY